MSQIYKVYILSEQNENENEIFAIKPSLDGFNNFKEQIFTRLPKLQVHSLKFYYKGMCSHFLNFFFFSFFVCALFYAQFNFFRIFLISNS